MVVSRNSISGIDRESGLYPEWGWLWGIRPSLQKDEHSQFVQLTFSKSFSDLVAQLSWLFIGAYAVYPHICIHYADFSTRFHAAMLIFICKKRNRIFAHMKNNHMPSSIQNPCLCQLPSYLSMSFCFRLYLYIFTDLVKIDSKDW